MRTKSALLALALLAPLLVAAPARASFPGDNGRLAYIRADDGPFDLVTMDAMNIADKEVVLDDFYAMPALAWGPDGTLAVVLQRTEADPLGLYSVDHETGEIELITTAVTGRFSWSPDGEEVVTTIPNPDGSGNLHLGVVDIATGAVTDLGVEGNDPSWAPDGSWIAYTDWQGSNENGDVWLIRPNGLEAHNFTNTPGDDEEGMIDWSPDATEIMVGVTVEPWGKPIRPAHQQHRLDIETGERTQVTVLSMNTNMPAWSPNGEWLVYQASEWWGFGSIQYGLFLRHVDATTGEEPTYAIADQEQIIGVSWQTDPGCLLGSSAAAPLSTGAASEPEVKFGSWVAQGCFTKKGSVYKTKDEMQLSGVTLKPTKGSISIDKDKGTLTSTHEVTVAIEGRVEGVKIGPIQLDKGVLKWNLKDHLAFKLQNFLELPVKDQVVVKPQGDGRSNLIVGLLLPQFFGLGVVSHVVRLRNGLGMEQSVKFEAPGPVHITDLVQLNNVVIEYNPATKDWATRGSIAGLGTSADIDFKHVDGRLVTAHVAVPTLSLAGLIELKNFRIEFDRSRNEKKKVVEMYTVAADTEVEDGTDSLTGQATYIDGALESFEVRLALAHFWDVVRIQGFNLAWTREDGWSGGGAAVLKNPETTIGAELELQLQSKKHKLIGGSITAPLILLGARPKQSFQLENVQFSYSNQVLPDGKPEEVWSGGAKVRLPGEEAPAVGGSFTFTNRVFTAGSIEAENVPLGPALKLKQIGGAIGLTPALSLNGSASVQLGPTIPVLGAATIGGTAAYRAAADPKKADTYTFGGNLDVGNAKLVSANVTYLTSGVVAATGNVSWRIGDLSLAEGMLNGYFDDKGFLLSGNASVGIGTHKVDGESKLNKQGVAGCLSLPGTPLKFGFGYLWKGEKRRFQGVCDMDKFLAPSTPPGVSGAAAAAEMPAGLDGVVFEIKGDGGPPIVTLEGPGGESVVVPASGEDGFVGGSFVFTDDESDATYVVVPSPSAGAWTVDEASGSVSVTGLRTADPMPELNLTGSVMAGDPYVLTYSAEGIGGQNVQFVERWADGEMPLGEGSPPGGTLEFDPSPGAAGKRSIVAIVTTEDGLVRDEVEVATYETGEIAPPCTTEAPCATSTSMKLKRKGTKVVLSGAVTPAPAGGSVMLLIERKRGKAWTEVASTTERPSADGSYKGSLKPKGSGKCRATATYLGTPLNEASAVSKSFACAPGNTPGKMPLL